MSVAANVLIEPSLTLKRRIKASPKAVYAAWTDPKKIVKWFGPDAGPVEHAELDLRVGGRYSIVFRTENGEEHHVSGVYREVVPMRSSSSPGHGARRRSASRWSPFSSSRKRTARC